MSVRDVDHGASALLRRFNRRVRIRIGVMGSDAASAKKGDGSSGLTVADVATFHEFGLGVPKRSFIRDWVDEDSEENHRLLRRMADDVARGRGTISRAADRVALVMQAGMQERITDGIAPPLDPATVERKGSTTPLIDTGQLRSSITGIAEVK